jgi:hypothetical protein
MTFSIDSQRVVLCPNTDTFCDLAKAIGNNISKQSLKIEDNSPSSFVV